MKRITAYLKESIGEAKCLLREKRVNSELESKKIHYKELIADADMEIDKLISELGTTDNIDYVLKDILIHMSDKENSELSIERLKKLKEFMDEEI